MNKPIIEASCTVNGVEYAARSMSEPSCEGCAARSTSPTPTGLCAKLAPCNAGERADHSRVIWVKAQ